MADDFRWWEEYDPRYTALVDKWRFVQTIYEADPKVIRSETFVARRTASESKGMFEDRLGQTRVVPLLSVVVRAYTGRVRYVGDKVNREFGLLGEPKDRTTDAGMIWRNTDGRGTNMPQVLSRAATSFTLKNRAVGIVDGIERDAQGRRTGGPTLRVLPPEAMPITVWEDGRMIEAMVIHGANKRASAYERNEEVKRFTVYSLDGHATYEEVEGENKKAELVRVDGGTGYDPIPYGPGFRYYEDEERLKPILPIFEVEMPIDAYPAYTLADLNLGYINEWSELRNKHRACNIIKLQLAARDKEDRDQITESIKAGSSVLFIAADSTREHKFIEPDATSLSEGRERLQVTRAEFLFSALREYEDSARGTQRTATEAAQDAAQGEHSYLNELSAALDEFETQAWLRIEQVLYPDQPAKWNQFSVERKRDFKPLDEQELSDRLRQTFFGSDPIPAGKTARAAAARKILDAEGIPYEEEEITAEVNAQGTQRAREDDIFGQVFGGNAA